MSSVPSYLWLSRHSIFYFRIVVPGVLRPLFPCSEIRRSLQTRCKREALIRGRELLLQVRQLYTQAFQGIRPSLDSLRGAWEAGGKRVASWAAWLRQQQLVALAEKPLEQWEGGKGNGPQKLRSAPSRAKQGQPDTLVADAPSNAPRFSKVVQECLEQQSHEGVAAKTLSDKRSVAELMIRIVGDLPVDLITRQDARKFREMALKLPPRMNQLPEGQSLEQIIETATTTISLTTFNNYVKNLTTFFSYAIREGYCERNPFDGLRVRQRGKVSEERSVFTEDDLRRLFSKQVYASAKSAQPHKYWLPLLGLYTGARLNELCQLYLDDVVRINGIDCLHIRATRPDQKLKTVTSERLVPIHSKLKALGFLEFVQAQREAGHQRLFAELTLHKAHGYAAAPSKWFTRVRDQLGFRDGVERKDFHSFRHTLADHLKQKGIVESLVGGILGHQSGGITFSRYGKDFRPEVLAPVVEAVDFDALTWMG
ncbi:tyrosine-type recombinase/integrase [Stutzerimonas balearica]|uniref:tyrosine-type recombinase/integrase n=1 Tax=Stutzerimonas balearica TaxID=74829 RepID=UPI00190BE48C|nr:site-specific integrase [Stutzerimonas balearica]MBK3748791.1 tyrosine-type recombinase/integrase [Stutzerimonas balearica]MBK3826988.1 tyrosine-type recombinase/integrase [Stutzerimonas balearica]MBK3856678.1 tyrosine-type recombinase/integrase [Stutzerimonas balearica]